MKNTNTAVAVETKAPVETQVIDIREALRPIERLNADLREAFSRIKSGDEMGGREILDRIVADIYNPETYRINRESALVYVVSAAVEKLRRGLGDSSLGSLEDVLQTAISWLYDGSLLDNNSPVNAISNRISYSGSQINSSAIVRDMGLASYTYTSEDGKCKRAVVIHCSDMLSGRDGDSDTAHISDLDGTRRPDGSMISAKAVCSGVVAGIEDTVLGSCDTASEEVDTLAVAIRSSLKELAIKKGCDFDSIQTFCQDFCLAQSQKTKDDRYKVAMSDYPTVSAFFGYISGNGVPKKLVGMISEKLLMLGMKKERIEAVKHTLSTTSWTGRDGVKMMYAAAVVKAMEI